MTTTADPIITVDIHIDLSPVHSELVTVMAYPVHDDGVQAWANEDNAVSRGMITDAQFDGVSRVVTANEDADWAAESLSTATSALVFAVLVDAQAKLDLPDSAIGFPDAADVWAMVR
ncbi:hypothetical protein GCM10025867_48950 (plasmid) [Frondihabitans sucicola]|uniref:Uncharacterized protein n=1 Tax=Frondihabitans sucicola TaxID=1268041 RepID=A0ABN6Y5S6_9MICO|nr:hypothetical protein [Frondihabitans sucicola]BDZ52654.1 hypothetical protein GCM10025867_48950 [Frondihabitans sucicola]